MKQPLIGVIPLYDEEKESIWMLPGYLDVLQLAGAVPLILPLNMSNEEFARIRELFDGFLLTGGHDVSPVLYNEQVRPCCGIPCEARDRLELLVYQYAVEKDIPVLGICRGLQFINAAEGGTLYQDLKSEFQGSHYVEHHMERPYDRKAHQVRLSEGAPLQGLLGAERIPVNSYHHQAVKEIADSLSVMAVSEDGLTEGLYRKDRCFIWGVQWHPELSFKKDENQRKIVEEFVRACRNEKSNHNDLS